MQFRYDPRDEAIGPFDVDPNQHSQGKAKGRQPTFSPMMPEQFKEIRADFGAKFKEWSSGTSGRTTAEMAEILEYMVDDLDHFKTAADPILTARCFPRKCELIKHEIQQLIQRLKSIPKLDMETEEIMAYIRSAILRLTVEGKSDLAAKAETERFKRIHQYSIWDVPELRWTKEAEGLRTRLWTVYTNVNFSRANCCFQCKPYWFNERVPEHFRATI
ncbi:hypothetical protein F1880_004117 [Penicillium rolfsii]|nr:hypothetical protein F1880_004117 [Penicillium rolfsii]